MRNTLIVTAFCVLVAHLHAAEIIPVGEVFFTVGSSFFEGDGSGSDLNVNIAFVPAVKFSDKLALLPGYYSNYRGSKSVYELLGGGTLYQDSMSHNFTLRLINTITPVNKVKYKLGYIWNYFRETKDESWGEGLFDFEKFTAGIENERKNCLGMDKIIASFDILQVKFPEYASLASSNYGTEVTPGSNILDFTGLTVYLRGLRKLGPDSILDVNMSYLIKDFPDQNLILKSGSYSSSKRRDNAITFNGVYSRFFGMEHNLSAGLSVKVLVNRSNQDHYDASETKFVGDYYDYDSYSLGPVVSFGIKTLINISYRFGIKSYSGRFVQQSDGTYTSAKVENITNLLSIGISRKLKENIKLKISGNYFTQQSNQKYESVYKYEYDTYNLEAGIVYEF